MIPSVNFPKEAGARQSQEQEVLYCCQCLVYLIAVPLVCKKQGSCQRGAGYPQGVRLPLLQVGFDGGHVQTSRNWSLILIPFACTVDWSVTNHCCSSGVSLTWVCGQGDWLTRCRWHRSSGPPLSPVTMLSLHWPRRFYTNRPEAAVPEKTLLLTCKILQQVYALHT